MIFFENVVDTVDNRIQEVAFFHFGGYVVLAFLLCYGAIHTLRTVIDFYQFMWGDEWKNYREWKPNKDVGED